MTVHEVIRGLLKTGSAAASVSYTLKVCAKSSASCRPALDRVNGMQFVKRLLVGAAVAWIAVAVNLGRSVLDMLTEASAEFGEWAIARIAPCGHLFLAEHFSLGTSNMRSKILSAAVSLSLLLSRLPLQ